MAKIDIPAHFIITAAQRSAEALASNWEALRIKRDSLLSAGDPLCQRHRDQLDASTPTTLTAEQYVDLLTYRQALRDLPEQTADPSNPAWPALPNLG